MSEPMPDTTSIRLMIREAVEREVAVQFAQMRNDLLITQGTLKQFNTDLGSLQRLFHDLSDLVRGNANTGSEGLVKRVDAALAGIDQLKEQQEKIVNAFDFVRKWGPWFAAGLTILVASDNGAIVAFVSKFIQLIP